MTTSRQPWTLDGKNLRDANGNSVALFIDARDAEKVLEWQNIQEKLDTAEEKIQEIENVLKGEY